MVLGKYSDFYRIETALDVAVESVDRQRFSWPWRIYSSTHRDDLKKILVSLRERDLLSDDMTFCDIGFGSGIVVGFFAALGFRTYGIDKQQQAIEHSVGLAERIQTRLGKFKHAPQLKLVDIGEGGRKNIKFQDGEKIGDMGVYYCRINDEPATPFVVVDSISPKKDATFVHSEQSFEINPEYLTGKFRLFNSDLARRYDAAIGRVEMHPAFMPIFKKIS